jgi:putative nucleotidyltransferase with HDIG domain
MRVTLSLFTNTLGRRLFVLFLVCAMFPILGFSFLTYRHVISQLESQSVERLRKSTKSMALALYERLIFLEADMRLLSVVERAGLRNSSPVESESTYDVMARRFTSILKFDASRERVVLVGEPGFQTSRPDLSEDQLVHLQNNGVIVMTESPTGLTTRVLMVDLVDDSRPQGSLLVGEVKPGFLWGVDQGDALAPDVEAIVVGERNELLFSSFAAPFTPARVVQSALDLSTHSRQFDIAIDGERYLGSSWNLFTKPRFWCRSWTIVLLESRTAILAPMLGFRTGFPLIVLATFWIVLLLGIRSIRHRMAPLGELKRATENIAEERFDRRVAVTSGDEFEELAVSLNRMTERLERQFKAMATRGEIDRAILSSLDVRTISRTVVSKATGLLECDCVVLAIFNRDTPAFAKVVFLQPASPLGIVEFDQTFPKAFLDHLRDEREVILFSPDYRPLPLELVTVTRGQARAALALPVFLSERLEAVLVLGRLESETFTSREQTAARLMANQVAVALTNSNLIDELHKVNLGTLEAFARAVDAKSPWTAGHSERVTALALLIGNELGLDQKDLECLHRGALLHDVGKIGVPIDVLDKPSPLDDNERRAVQAHTIIGVRILEPLHAFRDVLPIIAQHHENYDGSGYPHGLSRDNIDLRARVLSLADVYDAMTSSRPYRDGMDHERVLKSIIRDAGHKFDPSIVEAFLRVLENEPTATIQEPAGSAPVWTMIHSEEGEPS